MSRKLTAATLALTVAGGVYLSAGTASASNMGFKLERSFPVVREDPAVPATAFLNLYLNSFSLFNGLGDVGNTAAPGNKCVGDAGSSAVPDGIIDSTDGLCDFWTDRGINGGFAFSRFNRDTCRFESQTASRTGLGITWGGTPFALERDAGIWITVSSSATPAPQNRAVEVGSHDPSFPGRQIRQPVPDCGPRLDVVAVPYHMMYRTAQELLCGLEGVDWVDTTPADGNPDTCTAGIYDGTHAIAVGTFDNVNDDSTLTLDNQFAFRSVTFVPLTGRNSFSGPNYLLTPGDAYIVSISAAHRTTTLLPPHF
jgi:hypothetical protein